MPLTQFELEPQLRVEKDLQRERLSHCFFHHVLALPWKERKVSMQREEGVLISLSQSLRNEASLLPDLTLL